MRRYRLVTAFLMVLLSFMLVWLHDHSIAEQPDTKMVVHAINSLGLDLYPNLKKGQDNLFFSPYSISSALAMAYAGARGTTAAQMAKTLHFSRDRQSLAAEFGVLHQSLAGSEDQKGCRLDVANGLWARKGFPLIPEFRALILEAYHGKFGQVDFAHEPEASRKTINRSVEQATQGKIIDIMPEGTINKLTKMVLTNAIYFKGPWARVFREKDTKENEFTLLDGTKIKVPLMHRTGHYRYAQTNGEQVLELPYKGKDFSMIVFLPKEPAGLEQFEQTLTSQRLRNLEGKLALSEVEVWLPKFKLNTPSYELARILAKMGMPDAFSTNADFSGIDNRQDLFLQAVLHKAYVSVNETGTEAAAATVTAFGSVGLREAPPVFRADHPFLFVIRHNPTKGILFMGRLTRP